jgi:hypothetical protein
MDPTTSTEDDFAAISATLKDALSPEIHSKLNRYDDRNLSRVSFDSDADWILYTVLTSCVAAYSTTRWPINVNFVSMEACEELLKSDAYQTCFVVTIRTD